MVTAMSTPDAPQTSPRNTLATAKKERLEHARSWADMAHDRRRRELLTLVNLKQPASREGRTKTAPPLWQPLEAWVSLKGRKRVNTSQHTLAAYQRALEALIDYANTHGVNLLRPGRDFGDTYAAHLASKYAPASERQHLAAVRTFYKMLRRWADVDAVPFEDVQPSDDPVPADDKNQPYAPADIETMLEHAGELDSALVLLCAHGGLRVSEACGLEWVSVDDDKGTLTVTNGKGGKARTVAMSGRLRAALAALAALDKDDRRVLPMTTTRARARLKALCERAGVAYLGAHSLRHSAGTRFYLETRSLKHVAKFLGHANEATASIYVAWADDLIKSTVDGW